MAAAAIVAGAQQPGLIAAIVQWGRGGVHATLDAGLPNQGMAASKRQSPTVELDLETSLSGPGVPEDRGPLWCVLVSGWA